ncbi:MAG TPA: SDR family oxidoreductase [Acidimicrobiales bacterium]|nr:SDR family oxidoreductase [Acidimicrobiales bacterium]
MTDRHGGALAGRRVVVTGATGGIGRVLVAHLAREGATLALVARSAERLHELAVSLPNGPHEPIVLDVTDEHAWASAGAQLAERGRVDGVVTAAAILPPIGPVGSWDVAAFRRTVDVNLTGTLLAITATLAALKRAQGSIVTFSGGGATGPFPRFDAYAASKAAVVRLTENLAAELAADGVRANCVAPGFVVTPMHAETLAAGPELAGPEYFERTLRAREQGEGDAPEPAAELTAFLLSEAAQGITGKLISAHWDPWRAPHFQDRLRSDSDLATIRRIDDQHFAPKAVVSP